MYKVAIRAQLENVTNLQALGDDFQYCIKTRCNSCNEVSEKWQYVSAAEKVDVPKSRGTCNMLIRCKLCNRVNTMDVLSDRKQAYTIDDVPNFKEIIAFECRGLSIASFKFSDGWQCEGAESKTAFTGLSLDEEWCEYDENANCPVGISEVEYKIN